jgi:serine/threonine protein phosphatase PrpC
LRRLLGLSSNSSPVAHPEEVSITYEVDEKAASAPEPVIEAPPPAEAKPAEAKPAEAKSAEESNLADTLELPILGASPKSAPPAGSMGTRPLPPLETIVPKPGQRMIFGHLSDVGMVRGNNQDSVFTLFASSTSVDNLPDFGLFIVADGMGGHLEGERASAITTRIVSRHVLREIYEVLLSQKMDEPERPSISDVLRAAVQEANDSVTEQIPEGGTTVTTTVIIDDLAYIAHVGDSRAYLITDDRIEQITRDHSLVQRLIELDQLTPEEAAEHPQRNVLYRAIGQSETLDVDAITRRLPPHSRLMLCSDGLWNMVPEDQIQDIVSHQRDPQEACNQLVKLANDRGGLDNITVTVIQMPG